MENNEENSPERKITGKKEKTIITVVALLLVLLAVAGSYAFFVANVNNDNRQEAELKTATMTLRFADHNGGISASLDFGKSITKEFLIENTGPVDATANMYFKDLTNTYLEQSLTYKLEYKTSLDSTDYIDIPVSSQNVPRSETPSSEVLAEGFTIPTNTTYYYRLTITLEHLDEVDQTQDFNAKLSTWFDLKEGTTTEERPEPSVDTTLAVLQKNGTTYNPTAPDFALAETGNAGLFSMDDDYTATTGKQSYYFRGAVPDNYVKFGGFYWRIIRINGDGSLRMIYDGKQAYDNGAANDLRNAVSGIRWAVGDQNLYDDAKYVGYMYGPANSSPSTTTHSTSRVQAQTNTVNSNAKDQVETWYRTNMLTNAANGNADLTPYLADAIFCNDRLISPTPQAWWTDENNDVNNRGFNKYVTAYGAWSRFLKTDANWKTSDVNPTFVCPSNTTVSAVNDKFTASTESGGNGKLAYPVGLITADEIVAAGSGVNKSNQNYYLYKSSSKFSWSLSPRYMYTNGYAYVFVVGTNGGLAGTNVNNAYGVVAPVINLKAEYASQLEGSGTMTSPYTVPGVN